MFVESPLVLINNSQSIQFKTGQRPLKSGLETKINLQYCKYSSTMWGFSVIPFIFKKKGEAGATGLVLVILTVFQNAQSKPSCSTSTLLHSTNWGLSFWHLPWQTVPGLQSLHVASSGQLQSLSLASVKLRPWHLKAPSWQTPRRRGRLEPSWAHSWREALAWENDAHDALMIFMERAKLPSAWRHDTHSQLKGILHTQPLLPTLSHSLHCRPGGGGGTVAAGGKTQIGHMTTHMNTAGSGDNVRASRSLCCCYWTLYMRKTPWLLLLCLWHWGWWLLN